MYFFEKSHLKKIKPPNLNRVTGLHANLVYRDMVGFSYNSSFTSFALKTVKLWYKNRVSDIR